MDKYLPSNGTEGECFFESWCRHCQRDRAMRDDVPMCIAFVPAGDPVPPPKDDRTADLFGSDAA